jgi:hypothetical protein
MKVVYSSLLLHVYFYLNSKRALWEVLTIENDDFFFGWIVLSDDVIKYTLKKKIKCFTNYVAYDFIIFSWRWLYVLETYHVLEVKSMLSQYGFFLWMVLDYKSFFNKCLWFCHVVFKVHVVSPKKKGEILSMCLNRQCYTYKFNAYCWSLTEIERFASSIIPSSKSL